MKPDISKLRELANNTCKIENRWSGVCFDLRYGMELFDEEIKYIAAANPQTILALLDELDRLNEKNARLIEECGMCGMKWQSDHDEALGK